MILDGALIKCFDANMRTTIELPDELFRRAKAHAAREGRSLKDLVAIYLEQGLRRNLEIDPIERRRSPLPIVHRSSAGRPLPALTNAEIAEILDEEDAEHCHGLAGR